MSRPQKALDCPWELSVVLSLGGAFQATTKLEIYANNIKSKTFYDTEILFSRLL